MSKRFHAPLSMSRRHAMAALVAGVIGPFLPNGAARASDLSSLKSDIVHKVQTLREGRDITLKFLIPEGSSGNLLPIIQAFQNLTGVMIHTTQTPVDDINTELLLDALGGAQRFDLALPATFGLADLVSAGAILPISPYVDRHEPEGFRRDILFGVGDSFDDQVYGFQTDGDAYMMFYNKNMLMNGDEAARYADAFGTALTQPQTWEELDRQMAFFHQPDQGRWGGLLFRTPGYLAWEWWVRFHAKGVWPFSREMEPQIASDAGVEALEDMIRASEYLHPDTRHLGLFENWERFSRGDVYCNIGWGGSQKFLNAETSAMRGNMAYGPTPGGVVDGQLLVTPYFNWGWNYVVTTNSQDPEIAYLFALFASTPEMSTLAVRQEDGFFDPFRPEHYKDAGIQSAYSSEFLKVHRQSMENAIPDLYLQNQNEYFRALGEWLHRAVIGEIAPKDALERARTRWKLITNSSGRVKQQQRWRQLRGKYPTQIQKVLKDIE